jgi:cytoskeletal protein CcmA (bactofilin family)
MAEANILGDSGAYLGPGIKINGKLQFDGPATIEGEIEGEIIGHARVTIGQQATREKLAQFRWSSRARS